MSSIVENNLGGRIIFTKGDYESTKKEIKSFMSMHNTFSYEDIKNHLLLKNRILRVGLGLTLKDYLSFLVFDNKLVLDRGYL